MIQLEIEFSSTFCNSWPCIEIMANQHSLWQGTIEQHKKLDFSFTQHTVDISITGIGKSRGENQVWDTLVDEQGKIIQDKSLTITKVTINGVDMTQHWIDRLPNIHYGVWYDNYTTDFCIESPVMDWIIKSKFFDANTDQSKKLIFNNYNKKWEYADLQKKIAELRERLPHA